MTRFAPGQVVTVFRSGCAIDAGPGYDETTDEMVALARKIPGFVDDKFFDAEDGERVSVVTFDGADSQRAWREHPAHRPSASRRRSSGARRRG